MGSCCSAPVSDAAEEGQRRSVNSSETAQAARQASKSGGGTQAGSTAAGSGQQHSSSKDASKSILGRCDDMKTLYKFDKVLGKGQFGVTRLVVDSTTGEQFACKSISKRKLVSAEDMEDVRREIKVMHHLSGHPHVVTFKGAYEDSYHIHIVMELCTGEQEQGQRLLGQRAGQQPAGV